MKRKMTIYGGAAMLLLAVSILFSLSIGSAGISVRDVWGIMLHQLPWNDGGTAQWSEGDIAIVTQVRLSRVLLAVLTGACLALAGAGFQGVLRNPLADPYTLGVASGSSVGAAFLILFGFQAVIGMWTIPIVAFATGSVTLLGVLWLARGRMGMQLETLILSGVIVQSFFGAFVSFMVSMSDSVVNQILFWLMGSLAMKSWIHVYVLIPFLLIGLPILILHANPLNLFSLGERHASHLGIRVERTKLIVLIGSTLLTAAAVSVAGVVGFVGLVIPHLLRLMIGPDYRLLIPLSAFGGGIFLLWADTLARMALSPKEIPLGVVTALIGAPFFAFLLHRRKNGGEENG
ncbi:iron ABC transporter permease [Paenibacillus sp. NEAU-GSW1]|uniref:FecCD family ABC transporter permease n=1 Tax=Paenibacillus sp. NEAU-GSW1 TaxID=2682486 RepID=UPI0012E1DCA2|nr:iron ABC transporter permease [Paenibacillus sp. NEAU-GSW1]MUT67024.1 iron chelate uptake ABC transporter family permease subunit [Paenibacillus sp. NEAU-GSW1]